MEPKEPPTLALSAGLDAAAANPPKLGVGLPEVEANPPPKLALPVGLDFDEYPPNTDGAAGDFSEGCFGNPGAATGCFLLVSGG